MKATTQEAESVENLLANEDAELRQNNLNNLNDPEDLREFVSKLRMNQITEVG